MVMGKRAAYQACNLDIAGFNLSGAYSIVPDMYIGLYEDLSKV
jgi:hypothetical protein